MTMEDRCREEVRELHTFFEDWFTAKVEPSEQVYARFVDVLSEGFQIVSPSGGISARTELIEQLRAAHGSRSTGTFRIWTEHFRGKRLDGGFFLANYEEWQEVEENTRGRLSSALFQRVPDGPDAPNGVQWLHVHETWLP